MFKTILFLPPKKKKRLYKKNKQRERLTEITSKFPRFQKLVIPLTVPNLQEQEFVPNSELPFLNLPLPRSTLENLWNPELWLPDGSSQHKSLPFATRQEVESGVNCTVSRILSILDKWDHTDILLRGPSLLPQCNEWTIMFDFDFNPSNTLSPRWRIEILKFSYSGFSGKWFLSLWVKYSIS